MRTEQFYIKSGSVVEDTKKRFFFFFFYSYIYIHLISFRSIINQTYASFDYAPTPHPKQNREKLERAQNLEHVEQLSKGVGTDVVKFGDIIQLQHVNSEKFLATHKTPARLNPNCRKVSLKEGSRAANFRIVSRFKVRSLGSIVHAGDQIQLQSVKFPQLRLGVHPTNTPTVQARSSSSNSLYHHHMLKPLKRIDSESVLIRPSAVLKHESVGEVHGTIDLYGSFIVDLYRRPSFQNNLVTGNYFRLYHPEASG
jgi:hypothetical protein